MRPNTRMIWLETPTNPLLKIFDIEAAAAVAQKANVPLVVDNTFATPVLQQPLALGATAVVHSTTKYLNGHSDVVGGVFVTSDDELKDKVAFLQNSIGAVPSPFDCYMVLRGIKTLGARMRNHVASATEIASWLESTPASSASSTPGLPSHPGYELAKRQMRGAGGMISFVAKGGLPAARRVLERVQVFTCAESLGGVESLAEHPAIMTHASVPPENRQKLGIDDGLVRLSVGLEGCDDLIEDLQQALFV